MTAIQISYEEARSQMQPGDVIAFGGKSQFSEIIKFSTSSTVSHVGVILQTRITTDDSGRFFNQIIESTSENGVDISRLSDRLTYDGEIWWLPLSEEVRQNRFDQKAFYDFLFNQAKQRKPYDIPQAIGSALDALDNMPFEFRGPTYNKEDFSKFFCSELVAAGLEVAGAVGSINASEVTPIDLCRWNIYQDSYYQLKGNAEKRITRFNRFNPLDWND